MDHDWPRFEQRFDVWSAEGKLIEAGCTLARAAEIAKLDEAEVIWAVEEEGRVDTDTVTILPASDTWTPFNEANS